MDQPFSGRAPPCLEIRRSPEPLFRKKKKKAGRPRPLPPLFCPGAVLAFVWCLFVFFFPPAPGRPVPPSHTYLLTRLCFRASVAFYFLPHPPTHMARELRSLSDGCAFFLPFFVVFGWKITRVPGSNGLGYFFCSCAADPPPVLGNRSCSRRRPFAPVVPSLGPFIDPAGPV